jgi:hypothetical protein
MMMKRVLLVLLVGGCADPETARTTTLFQPLQAEEPCGSPVDCLGVETVLVLPVLSPGRAEEFRPESAAFAASRTSPKDLDGDGVSPPYDCDDADAEKHPTAPDVLCDGIDQNCNGFDECDGDLDGFDDLVDCAPTDPAVTDQCKKYSAPRVVH